MIRFIKGTLAQISEGEIVLEHQGMGFAIFIPGSFMQELPSIGEELTVYTYLNVREDAMQLFGFLTQEDLEVFKLLITVNGIGPKAALSILGVMGAYDLKYAVMADDAKAISKVPGIGPKTAGKLILELKDKLSLDDLFTGDIGNDSGDVIISADTSKEQNSVIKDAIEAFVVLGYPKTDATKAVRAVDMTIPLEVDELLKQSLKNL